MMFLWDRCYAVCFLPLLSAARTFSEGLPPFVYMILFCVHLNYLIVTISFSNRRRRIYDEHLLYNL